MKEKRYIKKSTLEKYTIPEWTEATGAGKIAQSEVTAGYTTLIR